VTDFKIVITIVAANLRFYFSCHPILISIYYACICSIYTVLKATRKRVFLSGNPWGCVAGQPGLLYRMGIMALELKVAGKYLLT
jgi:hypothetical protein